MELANFLGGFIKFCVVMFFMLAVLALLWYAASLVLHRLYNAARLTHTYLGYRNYLAESERAMQYVRAPADLVPVPFIGVGCRKLQHLLDSGFIPTGITLRRAGETCQISNFGKVTHTGLEGEKA